MCPVGPQELSAEPSGHAYPSPGWGSLTGHTVDGTKGPQHAHRSDGREAHVMSVQGVLHHTGGRAGACSVGVGARSRDQSQASGHLALSRVPCWLRPGGEHLLEACCLCRAPSPAAQKQGNHSLGSSLEDPPCSQAAPVSVPPVLAQGAPDRSRPGHPTPSHSPGPVPPECNSSSLILGAPGAAPRRA